MDRCEKLKELNHKELVYDDRVLLRINTKIVCKVKCSEKSIARPLIWDIKEYIKKDHVPTGLICTKIYPAYENRRQQKEWENFMRFLDDNKKVALANTKTAEMYILPASLDKDYGHAVVQYLLLETSVTRSQSHVKSDDFKSRVLLTMDYKSICRVKCAEQTISKPWVWDIEQCIKKKHVPTGLNCTKIYPAYEDERQKSEWNNFMRFLDENEKAALTNTESGEMYILPASLDKGYSHAVVQYLLREASVTVSQSHVKSDNFKTRVLLTMDYKSICRVKCAEQTISKPWVWDIEQCIKKKHVPTGLNCTKIYPAYEHERQKSEWNNFMRFLDENEKAALTNTETGEMYILPASLDKGYSHAVVQYLLHEASVTISQSHVKSGSPVPQSGLKKNCVSAHCSFLKSLGQIHADWIFGALAEYVDNSKNANATTLYISIDMIYSNVAGKEIPMLAVLDDGSGMNHEEIFKMVSFGAGFKAGTMRLGRDALVITQTTSSRSIAFLSQSMNEKNNNVEIPTVTYSRKGQLMELDTNIQTEASAKYNLKAIMDNSPFNEYLIGEKASLFNKNGTGTQIYVWNLDEWGSQYSLEWVNGLEGGSSFQQGDILIRSRRARSRPGQMTRQVRLDYSLQSYLEVIFLDPRMRIYVQGSLVKSRPISKCLHMTTIVNGEIMGKPVQLILGQSQIDLELGNCGVFLFWHGRLIEAYKRVGTMVYNGAQSHGVIGVIDVTNIIDDDSGHVWVQNNKQGFVDCEAYALLVDWLSEKADDYLDLTVDKVYVEKVGMQYKPDRDWVQCDKCRKWRMLPSDFDIKTLEKEWFCYLKPFNGKCDIEEQKVEEGVITIASQRTRYGGAEKDPNIDKT